MNATPAVYFMYAAGVAKLIGEGMPNFLHEPSPLPKRPAVPLAAVFEQGETGQGAVEVLIQDLLQHHGLRDVQREGDLGDVLSGTEEPEGGVLLHFRPGDRCFFQQRRLAPQMCDTGGARISGAAPSSPKRSYNPNSRILHMISAQGS